MLVALILVVFPVRCFGINSTEVVHQIYEKVFERYNRDVRPVKDPSKSVEVSVALGLHEVRDVDESMEKMVTSHWFTFTWRDEFLTWNKSEYGGITSITVPAQKIWVPDLYVSNSRFPEMSLLTRKDYVLSVGHNGMVTWHVVGISETHCKMRVEKFPFDTQVCSINLSQWASFAPEVSLLSNNQPSSFVMCFYKSSRSWDILDYNVTREPICGNSSVYEHHQQIIKFALILARRPLFQVMSIILPVCLLSLLNPVVFLVPPESGEKISLTISILLSYFVVLSALTSTLPEVSDSVSYLSVYVCSMLCLKVITVLCSVGIMFTYYRPNSYPIRGIYLYLGKIGKHAHRRHIYNRKHNLEDSESVSWKDVAKTLDHILFYVISVFAFVISGIGFYFLLY